MQHRSSSIPCATYLAQALLSLALCSSCERGAQSAPHAKLALDAPLPQQVPPGTELRIGDSTVQRQLELDGADQRLPFRAAFQGMMGGPATIEAFRADVLDVGGVGDTPPIHAAFTGLDIKIVSVQFRREPSFRLAIAPGTKIAALPELRGKRIAYSPGQAQGALVLRALKRAGLRRSDVTLVELSSAEFKDALASRQVDVAPLTGPILARYLREYAAQGASAIAHGVRDGLSFLYVRTQALEEHAKAAAIRSYVQARTRAQLWAFAHQEAWVQRYFVKDQGLSAEQGRALASASALSFPADWGEAIALTQETADMIADESGRARIDVRKLFDRRFEKVAAEAAATFAAASEHVGSMARAGAAR